MELTNKQVTREVEKRESLQKKIIETFGQDFVDSKIQELCTQCRIKDKCKDDYKLLPVTSEGKNCIYYGT